MNPNERREIAKTYATATDEEIDEALSPAGEAWTDQMGAMLRNEFKKCDQLTEEIA